MGWKQKSALGILAAVVIGWGVLDWSLRDPWHPVTRLPVAGKLILSGVTVVDPRSGALAPDMTILTDHGRIVSVSHGDPAPSDRSIRRVQATGKFVVPGYNDMHAHLLGAADPSIQLSLMLASGVTGFRQMSGSDAILAEKQESRLPIGPDAPALLITTGAILTPLNAGTPEAAVVTVRAEAAEGADFIKVGLVDRPELYAVLAEARRLGKPVAGHVPVQVDLVDAARRGMHAIEHLGTSDSALVACSSQHDAVRREMDVLPPIKLPSIAKFPYVAKLAGSLFTSRIDNPQLFASPGEMKRRRVLISSFDEARCREAARALIQAGNWQVPTLIRLKTTQLAGLPEFASDPNLRYVAASRVADWREATAKFVARVPAADRQLYARDYALSQRIVKLFDEEGAPMLAGSDVSGAWEVPGFSLHSEFDELAAAGLSPLRILQMTTTEPARFLGRDATMGLVAPGMNADLVLLDADPTKDVRNLHRIAGVVRAGFYHDRAALDGLLASVESRKGYIK